jgi:hypothetical protein
MNAPHLELKLFVVVILFSILGYVETELIFKILFTVIVVIAAGGLALIAYTSDQFLKDILRRNYD